MSWTCATIDAVGPYRHDAPIVLPTKEEVREWLQRSVSKPTSSRWRRWLGEATSFRYEIDAPVPWENDLFGVQRLFTVHAREPGLLPLPRWERGHQGAGESSPWGVTGSSYSCPAPIR